VRALSNLDCVKGNDSSTPALTDSPSSPFLPKGWPPCRPVIAGPGANPYLLRAMLREAPRNNTVPTFCRTFSACSLAFNPGAPLRSTPGSILTGPWPKCRRRGQSWGARPRNIPIRIWSAESAREAGSTRLRDSLPINTKSDVFIIVT